MQHRAALLLAGGAILLRTVHRPRGGGVIVNGRERPVRRRFRMGGQQSAHGRCDNNDHEEGQRLNPRYQCAHGTTSECRNGPNSGGGGMRADGACKVYDPTRCSFCLRQPYLVIPRGLYTDRTVATSRTSTAAAEATTSCTCTLPRSEPTAVVADVTRAM